jgi:hypothetical protein
VWPFKKKSPGSPLKINDDAEGARNEGFGVFSPLFEGGVAYLTLLNLGTPDATTAISLIMKLCASASDPYQEVCRLLRQPNWRPHIVGAVALATLAHDPEATRELWSAIDKRSWVTPQLAAAAFLCDPTFADHARERLRLSRRLDTSACARLPALERHISVGPAGRVEPSAKAAAALVRLLELLPHPPDWLSVEAASLDLQNLIKRDRDSSAELAEQWSVGLKNHLGRLGAGGPATI